MNKDRELYPIVLNTDKAKGKPNKFKEKGAVSCPFCDKATLYAEEQVLEEKNGILWIKNKFPVLEDTEQTLIVETPNCEGDLTTYSLNYTEKLFQFAFQKRQDMLETQKYKEVLFFKNHGWLAGGSIPHEHMQLVGLQETSYLKKTLEESIAGAVVHESEKIKVTVSRIPVSEEYEFNIIWPKNENNEEYVGWVQHIVKFFGSFKKGKFTDYNMMYHENEVYNVIKIFPRYPKSIYLLGYGLHLSPSDVEEVANELKVFVEKNRVYEEKS